MKYQVLDTREKRLDSHWDCIIWVSQIIKGVERGGNEGIGQNNDGGRWSILHYLDCVE